MDLITHILTLTRSAALILPLLFLVYHLKLSKPNSTGRLCSFSSVFIVLTCLSIMIMGTVSFTHPDKCYYWAVDSSLCPPPGNCFALVWHLPLFAPFCNCFTNMPTCLVTPRTVLICPTHLSVRMYLVIP